MKLALVILNWNGSAMMRSYLPSVTAYSSGEGVEIIVADNASDDDSLELLEKEFPAVRVIRLSQNYGFAEGYNKALAQVEADYYLLLNSDVEVTEGWLDPLLNYMDSHPEVVACQPKIRSLRERGCFEFAGASGGFIDLYGYPFCRGRILNALEKDNGQYDTVCPVFWATGAALMIRADSYRKAGGFDGRFFAHMEEIDLCWRLNSRGYKIVCIPQSVVYHLGGGTLSKGNPRKTYLNFRNNLLMLYKNLPENELKRIMRIRAWLDRLAAVSFLLKGSVNEFRAVFRARRDFNRMRGAFLDQRAENLKEATSANLPGRINKSIVFAFYIRRIKTFGKLFVPEKV